MRFVISVGTSRDPSQSTSRRTAGVISILHIGHLHSLPLLVPTDLESPNLMIERVQFDYLILEAFPTYRAYGTPYMIIPSNHNLDRHIRGIPHSPDSVRASNLAKHSVACGEHSSLQQASSCALVI